MCIVFFAYRFYDSCPFLLLDNRDEFLARKTHCLYEWEDIPNIIGGRDEVRGGTWMGVSRSKKRFVVLTNKRIPYDQVGKEKDKLSRGKAVVDALLADSIQDTMKYLSENKDLFGGFNLILGDLNGWQEGKEEIWYFGNYLKEALSIRLVPGRVYGLSNDTLDFPWDKVILGKQLLSSLGEEKAADPEESFRLLRSTQKPEKESLTTTVLRTLEDEYQLSSIFVDHPVNKYATRTSSLLLIPASESSPLLSFYERSFGETPDLYTDIVYTVPL